jgi:hypothetical protein
MIFVRSSVGDKRCPMMYKFVKVFSSDGFVRATCNIVTCNLTGIGKFLLCHEITVELLQEPEFDGVLSLPLGQQEKAKRCLEKTEF